MVNVKVQSAVGFDNEVRLLYTITLRWKSYGGGVSVSHVSTDHCVILNYDYHYHGLYWYCIMHDQLKSQGTVQMPSLLFSSSSSSSSLFRCDIVKHMIVVVTDVFESTLN